MNKKILSLVLAVFILFGAFAPMAVLAEGDEEGKTEDKKYDITLHKIVMDSVEGWPKKANEDGTYTGADGTKYDGSMISDIGKYFGNNAKPLNGVYFEIYKADEDGNKTGDPIQSGLTEGEGTINFTGLPAGDYIIDEVKEKSKVADGELSGAAAVPVKVTLPVYKADGTTFTTIEENNQLHVYPKNTLDEPPVDKSVTNEGNKYDSFDFDTPQTWIITNTVPKGIEDYVVYKFTDKIDTKLDYIDDSVEITVGGVKITEANIAKGIAPENEGETGKIYVDQPSEANGRTLTVDFKYYISQLEADQKIKIEYKTKINDTAIMGQDIPNEVELEFGNNPDETKKKKPETPPKVYTGGKRFKKTGEGEKGLEGAEFVILRTKNEKGEDVREYLLEDKETGKRSWEAFDNKNLAKDDPNIKILTSGSDGTFEIEGLDYGDTGDENGTASKDYYLEEIKAPKEYALLKDPIKFTVDKTSYFTNPDEVKHTPTDPDVINNKKITIPQTGGIGTIIFTVVGLSIMSVAVLSLRKRKTTESR